MPPGVSIVIPARNEERALGRCLDSLLCQDYHEFELIVVNDQSTDQTAEIVRTHAAQDSRVHCVNITTLPPGWTGKNHALARGVSEATAEWLLFTDADTWHAPHALGEHLKYAQAHDIDLLSISPDQECVSVWEKLLQPTVFETFTHWFSYRRINDHKDEQAAGNGQYLMFRRSFYHSIGGHEAVKGCIIEDVELARQTKGAGGTLWFAPARGNVRTRMYHGLREIWQGWAKNLYLLQGKNLPGMLSISIRSVVFDIVPIATLLAGTWFGIHVGILAIAATALITRWRVLQQAWRRLGFDAKYSFLYPLGSGLFLGMLWHSALIHSRGYGVVWKGRICKEPS